MATQNFVKTQDVIDALRSLSDDDKLTVLDAVFSIGKDNDGQYLAYTEIFDQVSEYDEDCQE